MAFKIFDKFLNVFETRSQANDELSCDKRQDCKYAEYRDDNNVIEFTLFIIQTIDTFCKSCQIIYENKIR